jgi:hypothetical protein
MCKPKLPEMHRKNDGMQKCENQHRGTCEVRSSPQVFSAPPAEISNIHTHKGTISGEGGILKWTRLKVVDHPPLTYETGVRFCLM